MLGNLKHYYVCANSAQNFVNHFDSNLKSLERLYILKGGPGTGKSTLMKQIGDYFLKLGYDIEHIHCSSDTFSLDGLIIPALSVGIVDGTAPHIIEPIAPGARDEYVNLGMAWESSLLMTHKDKILSLNHDISLCYESAYHEFHEAKIVHDEWETYYVKHLDRKLANAFTEHVLTTYVTTLPVDHIPSTKHRFFGATTSEGPVNFVSELIDPLTQRYFIKGRPGTGKSTLMRKIANKYTQLGYDIEIYYCSFDTQSVDMILVPELRVCYFDATAPHEYEPTRETDVVIDTYNAMIPIDVDELYKEQLALIKKRYAYYIQKAVTHLAKAKHLHDELESYYIEAVNFDVINDLRDDIISEILKLRD